MLEGLRLNPRSPAARTAGRRAGWTAVTGGRLVNPSLSTVSREGERLRSTGWVAPIHSGWRAMEAEVVG
jgi:hypothetical protein